VNQQCQKIDTWHITLINLENRNPEDVRCFKKNNVFKIDKMVLEICVILKKTSGRGWGRPRASTLEAFNLSIHPDHKYIWLRGLNLIYL
jgi:hypothetical protein